MLDAGRRHFITLLGGTAVAWPLAARAQQTKDRMRRIGFLRAAPPPDRELEAFLRGLADHGWIQGRNFVLVPQWGDGNVARLPELAVALVNAAVDIIVAEGVTTVRAARTVTATIPIVMTGAADPFVGGLVKSLARPGENITGFTTMQADIAGKYLTIFRDTVPGLTRVAVLVPRAARELFASAQERAAKALRLEIVYIDCLTLRRRALPCVRQSPQGLRAFCRASARSFRSRSTELSSISPPSFASPRCTKGANTSSKAA
jgi:putative ABC transport system substrate-binding protein